MKRLVLAFLFVITSSTASAQVKIEDLQCSADLGGSNRTAIEVQLTMGGAPENKTDYLGNTVSVGLVPGGQLESQQILVIELNGAVSKVYDPKHSLYTLEASNGVRVQCYVGQE